MKYVFIFMLFMHMKSFSQIDSLKNSFFNNDSIKYEIIYKNRTVKDFSQKNNQSSFYLIKVDLPRGYRKYLLTNLSIDLWLQNLNNEKTDWATNLILYDLYKKDASSIKYIFTDKEKWEKNKNEEINYWKEFLKRKR